MEYFLHILLMIEKMIEDWFHLSSLHKICKILTLIEEVLWAKNQVKCQGVFYVSIFNLVYKARIGLKGGVKW